MVCGTERAPVPTLRTRAGRFAVLAALAALPACATPAAARPDAAGTDEASAEPGSDTRVEVSEIRRDGEDPSDTAEVDGGPFKKRVAISNCGGSWPRPDHYCDAEILTWEYAPDLLSLRLRDVRSSLDCCGIRDVQVESVPGGIRVTETDAPNLTQDPNGGRCEIGRAHV